MGIATVDKRVMIVEDHQLLAESLEHALALHGYDVRRASVPRQPGAPATFVTAVVRCRPRVVLLDLDLGPFGDGSHLIDPITRAGSHVVVLTGSTEEARWGEALHHGARTVLAKVRPLNDIIANVRRINDGLPAMSRGEREQLVAHWRHSTAETASQHERLDSLTAREAEVLGQLMTGLAVRDIAAIGVVSEATVRTQVKSILAKLDVSSQLAAVGLANQVGWRAPGRLRR